MKKAAFLAILFLIGFAQQGVCATYTGSVSYPSGLYASDVPDTTKDWAHPSSQLAWTVDDTSHPGFWTYSYTFSVDVKNISHVIIEVSPTFALTDINTAYTTPGYLLDTYSATTQGNSNPGMPFPTYGLKWDGSESTLLVWTIVTNKAPTWGDFYAVGGKNTTPAIYAYSAQVLVPDTVVPIPAAAWLLGSGIVGLVALRRRFKK